MPASRLTVRDRICLLLDLDHRDVPACLHEGVAAAARIAANVPLDFEDVESVLREPEDVTDYRIDPNALSRSQWRRVLEFEQGGARPPRGRPFYSLAEVTQATGIPIATVESVFELPAFTWRDKPAERDRNHRAVTARYVLQGSVDPAQLGELGFTPVHSAEGTTLHLVEPQEFEGDTDPDGLKAELPGAVHPVLIDGEGFYRYLAPGIIDVWFADVEPWQARELLARRDLRIERANERFGHYVVALADRPDDGDITRAVLRDTDALNQLDEVRFAEPYQFDPEPLPDPGVPVTVDEFEAGDRDWNLESINLPAAHDITTGSADVTVFVIDSGAWMSHPDLRTRFRPDWEELDLHYALDAPPEYASPNERAIAHGTKVTGVVAGLAAIAPGCPVLPIKVSGSPGGEGQPGYGLRAEAILAAVSYLTPGRRAVMNLSWRTNGEIISIREALRSAADADIVICASAGNYAASEQQRPDALHYPSGHAWLEPVNSAIVSVGALAPGGRKASYSYYGPKSVTVMAPGGEYGEGGSAVFTTSTPQRYTFTYGTSFASPHAAGVAALVLSMAPQLTAAEVVSRLRAHAASVDAANPTHAGLLGGGGLDAAGALAGLAGDGSSPGETGGGGNGPSGGTGNDGSGDEADFIDLNDAGRRELAAVDDIGWYRAGAIVHHRSQHGPFLSVDDLLLTGLFTTAEIDALRTLVGVA